MLPDFTKLKEDIDSRLRRFLEQRMLRHLGPLSEIRRVRFFEGRGRTVVRESGEKESIGLFDLNATLSFRDDELPTLTLDDLLRRLDAAAKEMADQQARHIYNTISEAARRVGNVVDGKQKAFSAEQLLQVLLKIQIEFDRSGLPVMPSFLHHPDLENAVRLAREELVRNHMLREELKQLLILKREEWRVREASRRLVG